MPRSAAAAGATAVQNKPQGPPGPGCQIVQRPAYARAKAGLNTGQKGASLKRGGPAPNSPMSELGELMQEPAGGPNHGRRSSNNPEAEGRHLPLGADEWQAAEFMRSGGWDVVDTSRGSGGISAKGARDAGMTAHHGVLHPDEYVDREALRVMVEDELGFTYEQVRSVYRQGRLSGDQRELRGHIDARLLALSRAGANIALLGGALGFPLKDDGHCRVMENALTRARQEDNS